MQFAHTPAIWQIFPELVAGTIHVDGIHNHAAVQPALTRHIDIAKSKLQAGAESDPKPCTTRRRTTWPSCWARWRASSVRCGGHGCGVRC
jgi:hypothetical protein